MDLAPKATCHPLAVGEGGEGCRAVKMTPEWDAGTFSISTSWGTWAGKRMGSSVPSLLEGLAWVVGGLIPELVALGGKSCRAPTLGGCRTTGGCSFHMPISLTFTCPEVSVPPWRPLLTMAGPSILPRGGCAHFPQGLAVLGSMHWARGCHRQTAPLSRAWAAHGSVAEGGTRAETGAQWPEPVLSPAPVHPAGGHTGPG